MERLIEPLPRGLNRLAAPLFVFIFGIFLPSDYIAAAGDGTVPYFEPEVDLFAQLNDQSGALLKISVSFLDQPSSPFDGLPFSETVQPAPIPLNLLPPASVTPSLIPDAPFHVRENAA